MNTFPGESASWEGVDAYFTWAGSPGMLVPKQYLEGRVGRHTETRK